VSSSALDAAMLITFFSYLFVVCDMDAFHEYRPYSKFKRREDTTCWKTKRRVIGQMIVCQAAAAEQLQGPRTVPAEWLKESGEKRGLLKRFQLTVSGCIGPCDVPTSWQLIQNPVRSGLGKSLISISTGL